MTDGMGATIDRRSLMQLGAMLGITLVLPGMADPEAVRLAAEERALIAELSELIIPTTDTPGAKAAGVPDFIEMMVSRWFVVEEQDRFLAGLRDFEAGARSRHGRGFLALSQAERARYFGSLLGAAEAAQASAGPPAKVDWANLVPSPAEIEPPPNPQARKSPFVVLMKRLTLFGYYTSEIGASEELVLELAPGTFEPCATGEAAEHARAITFRPISFTAD